MSPAIDLTTVEIRSERLILRAFTAEYAKRVFTCITPGITRFMSWEPPVSPEAFEAAAWRDWITDLRNGSGLVVTVMRAESNEILGVAALHAITDPMPELGIWIKEAAQGQGFGREAVAALIGWASVHLGLRRFEYPVAEGNVASRRIAEALGGSVVSSAEKPKYNALIYVIPAN
jgi:RimJ/RimL family protein N-acetyltransferase